MNRQHMMGPLAQTQEQPTKPLYQRQIEAILAQKEREVEHE